jgi:hypothetical protein
MKTNKILFNVKIISKIFIIQSNKVENLFNLYILNKISCAIIKQTF